MAVCFASYHKFKFTFLPPLQGRCPKGGGVCNPATALQGADGHSEFKELSHIYSGIKNNTCDRIAGGERCGVLGALRNKDARMGPTFMVVCFRHQLPTPRRNASQWLLGTFCHQKVQK